MNATRFLVLAGVLLFITNFSIAQRDKEGSYVAPAGNSVVNTYTYLTANATAGTNTLIVNNNAMGGGIFGGNLAAGDLLMVIQMQGVSMDINTTPTVSWGGNYTIPNIYLTTWGLNPHEWGQITNYNNSGLHERVEVLSVSGANTITLNCNLVNNYSSSGHVQIIRIPRFTDLTVNAGSTINPTLWDGNSGGVIALEVNGNLTVNAGGAISASAYGFRGGQLDPNSLSATGDPTELRHLGSNDMLEGSEKGEGIGGFYAEYDLVFSRYGIGAPANAGGGGGYQNTGGGGGSNVMVGGAYTGKGNPQGFSAVWDLETPGFGGSISAGGGRGGYAYSSNDMDATIVGPRNNLWGGDGRKTNGGFGGHPLFFVSDRVWFGGGGGAGDQDSDDGGVGGRGGGLIFMNLYGSISGSGTIEAIGENGQNSNPTGISATSGNPQVGNDGAGGGGAGGSIHIENISSFPGAMLLDVHGGDGGDQDLDYYNPGFPVPNQPEEASGPGGSGSGGYIRISSGAPIKNLAAGANGTTNSSHMTEFTHNGATEGSDGFSVLPANPAFNITLTDVTICSGATANLVATITGAPLGTVTWFDAMVGGAIIATGNSFTTPALFATTTYWVGVCPGSFREPVTVTVTPFDDASFSYASANYCVNDLDPTPTITGLAGGTFSSSPAGLSINAATGQIDVSASTPATYTVTYTTSGLCPNSSNVAITISAIDDASFNYAVASYCIADPDPTPTITGLAGGTFSSSPAGLSINAATGQIDVSTSTPAVYTVTYTTTGACPTSSNVTVTITALDDASFSYSAAAYCIANADPTPTITGVSGGVFTSAPAGLSINAATGQIDVSLSIPATYTVTYSTAGVCANSSNVTVTITALDDASFSYASASYCLNGLDPLPTITGAAGGVFTSVPAGLSINSVSGQIDVSLSTLGAYTITYTTVGGCSNSSNFALTILALDDASFSYAAASYCLNGSDPTPVITGLGGGAFTSVPAGLSINSITGQIDVSLSTPGAYTVTYTTSGACPNSSNVAISIDALDDASFSYATASYCLNGSDPTPVITGLTGGSFTSAPVGLIINSATGTIDVSASTPGAYTITYTTVGLCPNTSNIAMTINPIDDATFNYAAPTYCLADPDPSPIITGLIGGTFTSSPAGLVINAVSGVIDVSASTVAVYTITYTTAGVCPASSSVTVEILAADNVLFTTTPTCFGGTASAPVTTGGVFSFGIAPTDGAVIDPVTGTVTGGTSGTTYSIMYTTAGSCGATLTVTVTALLGPVINSIADQSACDSYTLPVISGINLSGSEAYFDNSQAGGGVQITGPITSTQTVFVYDINGGGCSDETSFLVTITPSDDASFALTDFCDGDANSAIISGTIGGGFTFSPAVTDGASVDPSTGEITNGVAGITYIIEYTTVGVCPASTTQSVTIFAVPLAPIVSSDVTYCSNVLFGDMTASGGSGILTWFDDFGLINQIGIGGTQTPFSTDGTTSYYVNETENGCTGPASSINITIEDCDILIPTAFTPDNDGANDDWELMDIDYIYPNNVVKIYNRWGNLIFESVKGAYDNGRWDGTFKGKPLPVASYFYIIELNVDGVDNKTGSVTIILGN